MIEYIISMAIVMVLVVVIVIIAELEKRKNHSDDSQYYTADEYFKDGYGW